MIKVGRIEYINKYEFQKLTEYTSINGKIVNRERTFWRLCSKNPERIKKNDGKTYLDKRLVANQISSYYYKLEMGLRSKTDTREFLTVKEFALITGKSQSTIRRYIKDNRTNWFTKKSHFIKLYNNKTVLKRCLIKDFVSQQLLEKEVEIRWKKPRKKITREMNTFLLKTNWSLFGTVAYKDNKSKDFCFSHLNKLFNYLNQNLSNNIAIYGVIERNEYQGYHSHFVIYSEGRNSIKSLCDGFLRFREEAITDICKYDKTKNGIEYLNKKIDWSYNGYYFDYNTPVIFNK